MFGMKKLVKRKTHVSTGKSFSQLRTELVAEFHRQLVLSRDLGLFRDNQVLIHELTRSGFHMTRVLIGRGLVSKIKADRFGQAYVEVL